MLEWGGVEVPGGGEGGDGVCIGGDDVDVFNLHNQ